MSRRTRPYSSSPRLARGERPAVELQRAIATTGDGRDVTRPYVSLDYEEFRDRRLAGAVDWGVYDVILLDDQVKSCLEQRRSAVVSREWSVLPGNGKDPRSVAAASALEANLQAAGWDLVTDKMLYAPYQGVAVAELGWGPWQWEGRTLWGWVGTEEMNPIHVRHARRFRYDKQRKLRLLTTASPRGELLPDRKFWVVTSGGSDDDQPYGRGLAEWLYWPTLFKRNGVRFWNLFLDKCSVPTAKGTYPRGATKEEIAKLLEALQSIANDSGFVVPEGMAVELLEMVQAGIDFEKMPKYMDEAIAKIILSQTMTTGVSAAGLGSGQANVQAGVKQEVITADADMLSDSFNRGPARWFTDFNFGADVAAPIVIRQVEQEEDTRNVAATDAILARIGFVRTDESFRDHYGEGFVRKPPPETPEQRQLPDDRRGQLRLSAPDPTRQPASFAEGDAPRDIVDDAVDAIMADEGWRAVEAPIARLVAELAQAGSAEEVETILRREAELGDEAPLSESLARGAFAVRMAAAAGADGSD